MRYKILYIVLVLVTLFFTITYNGIFLPVLLCFELLMAALLFFSTFYLASKIQVSMEMKAQMASKGEEIPMDLVVRNRGFFPVNHFKITLKCSNSFFSREEREQIKGAVQGGSEIRLNLKISSGYCGRMQISLVQIRVYDYLRIFSRKRRYRDRLNINVLPEIYHVETEMTEKTRRFIVEGEEYEIHRSGDDPSEIYQVREFRNGDTMQRIHWKLSARTDELMTKEFSMPRGYKVLLLLDFFHEPREEVQPDRMDAFLEAAVSLSFGMVSVDCPHIVCWYDEGQGSLIRKQVQDEEGFYEMMEELMCAGVYGTSYALQGGFFANYPGSVFSTILTMGEKLELLANGSPAGVFTKNSLKEELEGYLLRV